MAQTMFSPQHRAQLNAAGLSEQHIQAIAATGCDPEKFVAAVPQLRQQAAAMGIDWAKLLASLPQIIALVLSFFAAPAPGPVVPPVQTG
jgi:sensor domain CHASE-containing protein